MSEQKTEDQRGIFSHTPGPWRVGSWQGSCHKPHPERGRLGHPGPGGPDGCVYEYTFSPGIISDYYMPGIAGPEPQQMIVTTSYDSLSIRWPDAVLIAAAPDLLAAAKAIAAAPHGVALGDLERLETAIAKAEGRA